MTPTERHTTERGQTMAEYALVLGVISLGVIVALGLFGGAVSAAIDVVRSAIP